MSTDFQSMANPGILQIVPYIPGRPADSLHVRHDLAGALQLASNENPLGASAAALEAAREAVQKSARYPEGGASKVRELLAGQLGIETERLVFGNGSNEVLIMLANVFLNPETSAVYSRHAFAVYSLAVQSSGAQALIAPMRDWSHDLEAMLALCREDTRMVFIANPNNPTGTWVNGAALSAFLRQLPPNTLVVLDEAYCEYVEEQDYPQGLVLQEEFPNLVLTRSFSKIHGLAGLRIGYCIAHPEIASLLQRIRQPFNLNRIAQAAAYAALEDSEHVCKSRALNRSGLLELHRGLRERGLHCLSSVANFLSFRVPEGVRASVVYEGLLQRKVIVRPIEEVYEMPAYLRVSVGLPEQNQRFLDALDDVFADAKICI